MEPISSVIDSIKRENTKAERGLDEWFRIDVEEFYFSQLFSY